MTVNLFSVPGSMAEPLQAFVLPQVWQLPDREQFWYIAAMDENGALMGAAVVDPVKPAAVGADVHGIFLLMKGTPYYTANPLPCQFPTCVSPKKMV